MALLHVPGTSLASSSCHYQSGRICLCRPALSSSIVKSFSSSFTSSLAAVVPETSDRVHASSLSCLPRVSKHLCTLASLYSVLLFTFAHLAVLCKPSTAQRPALKAFTIAVSHFAHPSIDG